MAIRKSSRAPQSRRERPAKEALTRSRIIEAARAIMRAEGLEKVTMRRIAAALDTGPAALYVYIRDTEDLHAQILDVLLDPVRVPSAAGGKWRDRLKGLVGSYVRVLIEHPSMARMALSTQPSGPSYLALCESILDLLHEGGVPDRDAAWAIDLLLLNATGLAVEISNRRTSSRSADAFSALTTAISSADATRYPNLARLGPEILAGAGPDRFDWALDVLLNGVLHTPRPRKKRVRT